MDMVVTEPDSDELTDRFDASGPGYTSYPTSDRFVEAFSFNEYIQSLELRRSGVAVMSLPLAIYVHIPFCESLCYYCTSHKIITKHHDRATSYLRYLSLEIDLQTQHLGLGQKVSKLHLGGGTPTFFSDEELRELMGMLHRSFMLAVDAEYSVKVDPRVIDSSRMDTLAELGFTRLSFGVQDFDPVVQKAVHRVQSEKQVIALVEMARQRAFTTNVDLIYGLPSQSPDSLERTLALVIALRPEQITLIAYTHLPERFKFQKRIDAAKLPDGASKATMLSGSVVTLIAAGYVHLGMGHFALSTDALAVAKRQGRLHRSLQGYSIQSDCDVIGLGVSSMSRIGATYSQNAKTLDEYCNYLDQGHFPVVRGLALSRDDLVRRAVIMSLVCHGEILFESIELGYLVEFGSYFAFEMETIKKLADQGLVTLDESGIQVTSKRVFSLRAVAMVFDCYLQADRTRARFSKII